MLNFLITKKSYEVNMTVVSKIEDLIKITEEQSQAQVKAESKGRLNARTVAYAAVATGVAVAVAAVAYYTMQTEVAVSNPNNFMSYLNTNSSCDDHFPLGIPEYRATVEVLSNTTEDVPLNATSTNTTNTISELFDSAWTSIYSFVTLSWLDGANFMGEETI
jgi:hypothetical protein